MSTKRTVIKADEELVIKGKLTIEGNVTQIETTQQVTNLQGNVFTINSDGSNTSAILALNSNGTTATMTFDDANGSIVVNKPVNFGSGNITAPYFIGNVIGQVSRIDNHTTTDLTEGTNLYFTAARARGSISVTDAGGDGSLTYSNTTGVFTYTGPSATEVRAHFSATNGIEYSNTTGVINLANTTAGDGLTYTNGVLAVGAGDGITVNADNVAVNNTVIRTTGDQTITGNTTFVGNITLQDNNVANEYAILPSNANVTNLGSWENHFNYVFANVLHAEYLDLGDANISDIHNRFVAGVVDSPYLTTNTANGLIYTHNASIAGYAVVAGDGITADTNVSVDSTVVRTTDVNQNIDGLKTFLKDVAIQGNLDVTGNINSLTQTDLYVTDTKITLANGSVSNVDAYIYVEGNYANNPNIKWDYTSSSWKFSNDGTTEYAIPVTTTDLAEGANLYYTSSRVNTAIDAYIIGGNGLTYSSGTITVGAGDGITVNADNVAVDASVVRTTGDQSIAGIKSFTGELVVPLANSATSNNAIYVSPSSNSCFIVINGFPVQLTADSDVGQVEDVGATGIDIYAGFRQQPVDNVNIVYHGIKSIDGGTYTSLSDASNVITVDANITAIRGAFSTANIAGYGGIGYDSANGVFNYSGVTDSTIRGLFSGSGLISYNSGTGEITTTADNYGSWTVQTDSGSGAAESISSAEKLTIQGGTNITVTNTGNVITITNDNTADITGVSAGSGLTGGGNNGDVTLNVGAGTGITVNSDNVAVNMGAFSTTDLAEGSNLYFTTARANTAMDAYLVGGDGLTYTSGTIAVGAGDGVTVNADNVAINVAYVRSQFSASGDLSYNASTGVFSFTNDAGDIESVTAGDGLTGGGSSGAVTLNIGAGAGITVNADNVALTSGIVTTGAKTYGTASQVPAITVDTYGRVTSVSNTSISITASQVSDFTTAANTAIDNRIVGGSGLTYSSGTLAVGAGSYIVVGADTVGVDATTTNTASKVVARDGAGNVYANYFVGTATAAQYADLAENYLGDADYLPGVVLVFGGAAEVTACTSFESTRVAGVVTTQPAHVMNSGLTGPNVTCIALRGRVPVQVKGVVRKGDVLVTAGEGNVGYAVASLDPRNVPAAAIVGKAITDKLDAGPGVVEALI